MGTPREEQEAELQDRLGFVEASASMAVNGVNVYRPADQAQQLEQVQSDFGQLVEAVRTTLHELRSAVVRVERKLVGISAEQVHHSTLLKSIQEVTATAVVTPLVLGKEAAAGMVVVESGDSPRPTPPAHRVPPSLFSQGSLDSSGLGASSVIMPLGSAAGTAAELNKLHTHSLTSSSQTIMFDERLFTCSPSDAPNKSHQHAGDGQDHIPEERRSMISLGGIDCSADRTTMCSITAERASQRESAQGSSNLANIAPGSLREASVRSSIGSSRHISRQASVKDEDEDDILEGMQHRSRRVRLRRKLREKWRDLRQHRDSTAALQRTQAAVKAIVQDTLAGQGEIDNEGLRARHCLSAIDPSQPLMVLRDIAIALFGGADMMVMPVILAWDVVAHNFIYGTNLAVVTTLLMDICSAFWTLNMLFGFRLGYYVSDGICMGGCRQAAWHYLRKFFLFDLCIVSGQWAACIAGHIGCDALGGPGIYWTMRMLGCLILLRVLRFRGSLARLRDWIHCHPRINYIFEPVIMTYVYFWCCNAMACVWYAVGEHPSSDTGKRWLDEGISSFNDLTYADTSVTFQYLTCIRTAFSHMALSASPVMAVNSCEALLAFLWSAAGVVLFGSCISFLSAKFVWMMQSQESAMQVVELRNLLVERGVRNPLRSRIVKHIREGFLTARQTKNFHQLKPLLDTISWSLRNDLRMELFGHVVNQHPLFKLTAQVDATFVRSFCIDATEALYLCRGKTVFYMQDDAIRSYFTLSASFNYTLVTLSMGATTEKVEQHQWVSEAALWCTWIHIGTLEAAEDAEVLAVDGDRVCDILLRVPDMFHFLMDYAQTYYSRLVAAGGQEGDTPTDLQVPGTDFDEIIWLLGTDSRIFAGLVAIEMLKNTKTQWKGIMQRNVSRIDELERQVLAEQSILIIRASGDVERVSLVTAIKVREGERLLWQLGKWTPKDVLEIEVRLPGQPQIPGESPEDALKRLIRAKLAPFAAGIHVNRSEVTSDIKESKTFRIPTKYSARVHHASYHSALLARPRTSMLSEQVELYPASTDVDPKMRSTRSFTLTGSYSLGVKKGDEKSETLGRVKSSERSPQIQEAVVADVYLTVADSTVYLFAWLTEAESTLLQTSAGETYLKAALNKFSRNAEVERRLTSWGWDSVMASAPIDRLSL